MSAPLGRAGLIGLAVGATAGLGLIALIIYRELSRRRARGPPLEGRPARRLLDGPDAAALLREMPEDREAEARRQALAAVEAAVQGLSPEQQGELRDQLDQVLSCVDSLRSEVAELRGGLKDIAAQIIQDVKKGVEDGQRVRRRRHLVPRERTDSTCSSSVYFTASQGVASTFEETSEGGYSTAYAESDYTDRDTDREEGEREAAAGEAGQESEEDEDKSCATVLTLRQEDSQDEDEEDDGEEEAGRPAEAPSGELALLLAQSDILHHGNGRLKEEGLRLLLDNRAEYGDRREFLWRLARAYGDAYRSTEDRQKRRVLAQQGREEAELALRRSGLGAECHKWLASLSGLSSQHDSTHGKVKSGQVLKEHLDRALALRDGDSTCFYLLGRWCFQVATLDWLEKKTAAALYQTPPVSTLHDALDNFLKAEELSGGASRTVRLHIAKCHMEMGNVSEATNWAELALKMPSDDDEEDADLEAELRLLTAQSL